VPEGAQQATLIALAAAQKKGRTRNPRHAIAQDKDIKVLPIQMGARLGVVKVISHEDGL
jgi:hypothetical protein